MDPQGILKLLNKSPTSCVYNEAGKMCTNKEYTQFIYAFFAMAVTYIYCRYEFTISDTTNCCNANLNASKFLQS